MTTFSDLGLSAPLTNALAGEGIHEPFPIQRLVIPDALVGRDVCGKAKTGSGKTLAFGLPLLSNVEHGASPKRPHALILAPTRELARQIVDVLDPLAAALGVRIGAIYGGASMDRQIAELRRGVEVVVATPGRLIDLLQRDDVALEDIAIVVIDEADRMADMGFLPQVEWLMRRLGANKPQTLLFSATLDGQVDVLVQRYLHDPVKHEVTSESVTVTEMVHRFLAVHEMDRVRVAAAIARNARTIAFVATKRNADRLTTELSKTGVRAAAIHGDLRQTARERALEQFKNGKLDILVATDVAARGIDVDDVDVVIHYDFPEDDKAYLHRSGRTARAGRSGVVATFVLWNKVYEVERLQKRLGLSEPVTEVFSNDPRLADLAGAFPSSATVEV